MQLNKTDMSIGGRSVWKELARVGRDKRRKIMGSECHHTCMKYKNIKMHAMKNKILKSCISLGSCLFLCDSKLYRRCWLVLHWTWLYLPKSNLWGHCGHSCCHHNWLLNYPAVFLFLVLSEWAEKNLLCPCLGHTWLQWGQAHLHAQEYLLQRQKKLLLQMLPKLYAGSAFLDRGRPVTVKWDTDKSECTNL